MRKYVKFNEVLVAVIIILLVIVASLATYILTKDDVEITGDSIEEIVKVVETINITKIIKEEVIDLDGCAYARTPGHIRKCLEKYG